MIGSMLCMMWGLFSTIFLDKMSEYEIRIFLTRNDTTVNDPVKLKRTLDALRFRITRLGQADGIGEEFYVEASVPGPFGRREWFKMLDETIKTDKHAIIVLKKYLERVNWWRDNYESAKSVFNVVDSKGTAV